MSVTTVNLGTQVTGISVIGPPSTLFPSGTPATALSTVPISNGQPPAADQATFPLNSWASDPSQEYILVFASTGLCLYQVFGSSGNNIQNDGAFNGVALWGPVGGDGGQYCCAQNDGNLVVYNAEGNGVWASGATSEAQFLCIQSDSNVVVYHLAANWSWKTA